jgi:octaprenyl-diphosphate synthase
MSGENGERQKITDEKIAELIDHVAEDVSKSIAKQLEDEELAAVHELISYQPSTGGKRLRPTLAVLISQAFGGDYEQTIEMATTAELLHQTSLVFDDVLDGDIVRRGKPSAHAVFGAGTAMMGGNILALLAFKMGGRRGFAILNMLIGTASNLALGSTEEFLFHEYDELRYLRIIGLKTASLFKAPCEIGAVMAGTTRMEYELAMKYGWNIGMLYQLTDDLVDILKTFKTGKPEGHMKSGSPTLAFIHAAKEMPDPITKSMLDKFLKSPPLPMEDFNILYHSLEDRGSIKYTLDRIEDYNRQCQELCAHMPDNKYRDYLLAMPSFLYRVLMSEVQGHIGLEGVREEPATDDKS